MNDLETVQDLADTLITTIVVEDSKLFDLPALRLTIQHALFLAYSRGVNHGRQSMSVIDRSCAPQPM